MVRLKRRLDPTRTGDRAERFQKHLRKLIVGQDEAVDLIVSAYQAFLAGMTSPGHLLGIFCFWGRRVRVRRGWLKRLLNLWPEMPVPW
jgi:hypothetical protein